MANVRGELVTRSADFGIDRGTLTPAKPLPMLWLKRLMEGKDSVEVIVEGLRV